MPITRGPSAPPATPSFLTDVVWKLARVIGGTAQSNDQQFFSGNKSADGSGVPGLKGCWAVPPDDIESTPVGVLYWSSFIADLASLGEEDNDEFFVLGILVARYATKSQEALLLPFRDSVPATLRAHMQAFTVPSSLDIFATGATKALHEYGGVNYLAIDFTIRVRRMLAVTYTP